MQDVVQEKDYYAKVKAPWMQSIVGHKAGALMVHWVFQGMLYMDPTERLFKIGLDLALLLVIGVPLSTWLPLPLALASGAVAAHTLNFMFNGQIYGVLKHFGSVYNTWDAFNDEVERLRHRAAHEPSIEFAAIYGSVAREEWSPASDIDLRIVRAPGLRSAWRACWFAVQERARAFVKGFPLDMFVLDEYQSLNKLAEKRHPVILVGTPRGTGEAH